MPRVSKKEYLKGKQLNRFETNVDVNEGMCYSDGFMRTDAWFTWFQDSAFAHTKQLGVDQGGALPTKLAWILLDVKAIWVKHVKRGEKINLETYPIKGTSAMFPRRFIAKDIFGKVVAKADTTWALMDIIRRRLTRSVEVAEIISPYEAVDTDIALLSPVDECDGELTCAEYLPSDIDYDKNGHVNNARYIAWLSDLVRKAGKVIKDIHCRYHSEVLPDESVILSMRREDRGHYLFEAKCKDRLCFAASGLLSAAHIE